jgi:hypothetical protein
MNPIFDFWYLAMISKFKMNIDHFKNKEVRKYQIYIYIKKIASDYLYPRYEPDTVDPF